MRVLEHAGVRAHVRGEVEDIICEGGGAGEGWEGGTQGQGAVAREDGGREEGDGGVERAGEEGLVWREEGFEGGWGVR
jgi:hypothetical protein